MTSLPETIGGIITAFFLLFVLSYYVLFFIRLKKPKIEAKFSSITILIPAHNEERYIADCIHSVQNATFQGKKEIIVIDDGSIDGTNKIASSFKNVKVLKTKHEGKSASLNLGLKQSKSDIIAVVDGDSIIAKDALIHATQELSRENTAAVCSVIKVKNRKHPFPMWSHIEQLYNSLMRSLFSKINANITTPGPLSVYRRDALEKIDGFSTRGFSEDVDVTIRLIRKGYRIGFAEKAVSETNIPSDFKGFMRQRFRFARGLINILKRHMRLNTAMIDLYTMPLFLFSYIQAIIMGSLTVYNIVNGYITYFFSKGIIFDFSVAKFFFEWFSIIGFIKWTFSVLSGASPLTFLAAVGIISTLLSYPLFIIAIIKFDRKIDLWHLIPFCFMFPFWLMIMAIYIVCIPEYFRKEQYNRWKKNE